MVTVFLMFLCTSLFGFIRPVLVGASVLVGAAAGATGVQPDTPLLVISEATGTAQMGVLNTDGEPLLLHTTIVDLPDSKGPNLYAIPPVTRIEGKGRQVVRFLLEKNAEPLKVQVLKRVRFEGIPPAKKDTDTHSTLRLTVSQDIPAVISPKGLEQDPEPWKKVGWKLSGNKILVTNTSPFVARLSQQVGLLPSGKAFKLLPKPYILPGDSFEVALPEGTDPANVTGLRLAPASPYGFSVDPYDVQLSR